jgi:hypothetical protein
MVISPTVSISMTLRQNEMNITSSSKYVVDWTDMVTSAAADLSPPRS